MRKIIVRSLILIGLVVLTYGLYENDYLVPDKIFDKNYEQVEKQVNDSFQEKDNRSYIKYAKRLLSSNEQQAELKALKILKKLNGKEAEKVIYSLTEHENLEVRREAYRALGSKPNQRRERFLLHKFNTVNAEEDKMFILENLSLVSKNPKVKINLLQQYEYFVQYAKKDNNRRYAYNNMIQNFPNEEQSLKVSKLALFNSQDTALKARSIRFLALHEPEYLEEVLEKLIQSNSIEVLTAVIDTMYMYCAKNAFQYLKSLSIRKDTDIAVKVIQTQSFYSFGKQLLKHYRQAFNSSPSVIKAIATEQQKKQNSPRCR